MYALSGNRNMGRLFENAVFLELRRRMQQNHEINYWKNKQGIETDFVVREGLKVKQTIQVVYELKDEKTKAREIKGLIACAKELRFKEGIIITKDFEDVKTFEGIKIKFIPLWKWLME